VAKKGRRLKRYLGLLREGRVSHQGGIEHLMPGRISGWALAEAIDLHEVRLLVGPHLIARAEINQPRPDVCDKFGYGGHPGFSLALPSELPPLDWSQSPRLLALSADGGLHVGLELLGNRRETAERLGALLQSEALGLEGHFDGLVDGGLQGWAARRGQRQPAQIWLQAVGQEPIAQRCDQWREGMASRQVPDQCGFQVRAEQLPTGWAGKPVWCSFDREGVFRLPQGEEVMLPANRALSDLVTSPPVGVVTSYGAQMAAAPEDLRSHWQALEGFRQSLDGLEDELNRLERLQQMQQAQPSPRPGLLQRLLGRV